MAETYKNKHYILHKNKFKQDDNDNNQIIIDQKTIILENEDKKKSSNKKKKSSTSEQSSQNESSNIKEEPVGTSTKEIYSNVSIIDDVGPDIPVKQEPSIIGARSISISDEAESQMDDIETDYYLNVVFSPVPHNGLIDENGDFCNPNVKFNRAHLIHTLVWEEHGFSKESYQEFDDPHKTNSIKMMVDCSNLTFDPDTYSVNSSDKEKFLIIEHTLKEISDYMDLLPETGRKRTIHLMISGFFPIEDFVFAFSRVMKHHLINENLYEEFITQVEGLFSSFTEQFENLIFKVDYACLYETYELQAEVNEEETAYRELWNIIKLDSMSIQITPTKEIQEIPELRLQLIKNRGTELNKNAYIEVECLCQRAMAQVSGRVGNSYFDAAAEIRHKWQEGKPLPDIYKPAQKQAEEKGEFFNPLYYIEWQGKLWSIEELDALSWVYEGLLSKEDQSAAGRIIQQRIRDDLKIKPVDIMHETHMLLTFGSILWSPLSIIDAVVHVVEYTIDGDSSHIEEAVIDIVCIIPFVRLFKVAKAWRLVKAAENAERLAKADLDAAKVTTEKALSAVDDAQKFGIDMTKISEQSIKDLETAYDAVQDLTRSIGKKGEDQALKKFGNLVENNNPYINLVENNNPYIKPEIKKNVQYIKENVQYMLNSETPAERVQALANLKGKLTNSNLHMMGSELASMKRDYNYVYEAYSTAFALSNEAGKTYRYHVASMSTNYSKKAAYDEVKTLLSISDFFEFKGLTHYMTIVDDFTTALKEGNFDERFAESIFELGGAAYSIYSGISSGMKPFNQRNE